jgi:hypothetical protein
MTVAGPVKRGQWAATLGTFVQPLKFYFDEMVLWASNRLRASEY